MTLKYYIALTILLPITQTYLFANSAALTMAEGVLDKIYTTNGNYSFEKPSLKIVDETTAIAAYYPRKNVIELEQSALDICAAMGQNSEAALAFILGHELAHAYQKTQRNFVEPSSYIELGITGVAHSKTQEREADIFGVFSAYLAGYKTVKILPTLIQKLYEGYDLIGKDLKKYPTLDIRKRTAREVRKKVEELIQIYEVANHLIAIGEYELAAASFNYISTYYKGPELLNNEGMAYVLHAMNFTDKNIDTYLYPLEIDWSTRLSKPTLLAGDRALRPQENRYRQRFLVKALTKFEEAQRLNSTYFSATINILCTYSLMKKHQDAITYYATNQVRYAQANSDQQTKFQLAIAIVQAQVNQPQSAQDIWKRYLCSKNDALAYQAKYNLQKSSGDLVTNSITTPPCQPPFNTNRIVDGINLQRITIPNPFPLKKDKSLRLGIRKTKNSIVYQFFSNSTSFVFQRIIRAIPSFMKATPDMGDLTLTTNGYINYCATADATFLMSEQGQMIEWGKFLK